MVQTCINVPYNGAGAHSRLDGRGGDWTFPPIARHFVGSILAAFRRLPRLVVLLGQTVSCTEHIHTQRHKTFNRMAGTPTTKKCLFTSSLAGGFAVPFGYIFDHAALTFKENKKQKYFSK